MIYLDNNATTQVAPEVFDAMQPFLTTHYGNPSSAHPLGRSSRAAIEQARQDVAELLGARHTSEIVFTSCGSESNNWAIGGFLEQNPNRRHIVTTRVEHEAVRKLCEHLSEIGCEVTWLEVDEHGALDLDDLRKVLRRDTGIVSIMLANNETGIVFPVEEIGNIIREHSDAIFHVDGVQAVAKIPISLGDWPVDLFSISGHKFHAPKGVGALYIRDGVRLPPFIIGGGQEGGRRSGTEAVPNIVGLGRASKLATQSFAHEKMKRLRDRLEDSILNSVLNAHVNGPTDSDKRLPNTSNISFEGILGPELVAALDEVGICVSTGSACHADSADVSPVLAAMKVPRSLALGSIRFSVGRYNTESEIDRVLNLLPEVVERLRKKGTFAAAI
ncbi:MAG TPA: aminotransferase class V-fold PLP-dependent enzyme [Pyrinomonadaceae bacterium]|jgi:cysteine desulfurase|nr:aminotransferase class V-fold PLP-dependent enzyme [Pyrinomonadaceae bacterium]